jgi:ribonuclease T2
MISGGKWYNTAGTPATYTTNTTTGAGPFTLHTSKGYCAILSDSSLTCASNVVAGNASVFDSDGNLLTYGDSTVFGAMAIPSGQTQGTVYASSSQPVSITLGWTPVS